jgi:APA family basic amino acid/polyamine antiporter
VAVTFARYAHVLAAPPWREAWTAVAALLGLTAVNLLGVRAGGRTQSVLMVLKIAAIAALILCGLWLASAAGIADEPGTAPVTPRGFLAAMIAVLFAYGGWATATFAAGEIRDSRTTLPRALIVGTAAVVALYLGVNAACLHTLGVSGLVASDAPASAVMGALFGTSGETFIALAVAVSTLGFLAQGMLVCPRVYYAMARDGLFFESVGRLHPVTGVPSVAVILQGLLAVATALTGSYDEILSWVVTVDFAFLALTAGTLFVFRARERSATSGIRALGHPWTTVFFVLVCLAVVAATFVEHPARSVLGWTIVGLAFPVHRLWRRKFRAADDRSVAS